MACHLSCLGQLPLNMDGYVESLAFVFGAAAETCQFCYIKVWQPFPLPGFTPG